MTVFAQDEAYSYLFQNLSGNCPGLNLVVNRASASDYEGEEDPSSGAGVHVTAVVYIKSGTACRDWQGIELGLERIFKTAAEKSEHNAAAWQFEGVAFEVWEAT